MDKGLKILLNAYWSAQGWKNGEVSSEDFETAKSQGYMFDYPESRTHDETVFDLKRLSGKMNPIDVANAFLYSLSTRKLEYRSALGSYYYARSVPFHLNDQDSCYFCDFRKYHVNPNWHEALRGLNILNFERYKWGGVRHDNINYALFDLEQFQKLPKVQPVPRDIEIMTSVLKLSEALEPTKKIGAYSELIISSKIFKTNKAETAVLLGLLGICDVFNTKGHHGYLHAFTKADGSRDPVEHLNDYKYPINMWRASDGINYDAVAEVLGLIISH